MSHASLTLSVKFRNESTSDFDLDFAAGAGLLRVLLSFGRPGTLFKLLAHKPPPVEDFARFCAAA
jgi:hypothetical protein